MKKYSSPTDIKIMNDVDEEGWLYDEYE